MTTTLKYLITFFTISLVSFTTNACVVGDDELRKQDDWRWDSKSQNLIYAGNSGAISPAGGEPNFRGSYNYVLYYVPDGCSYNGEGQDNWRWDSKSQNLIFAGNSGAISPAGGEPNFRGSYNYVLFSSQYGSVNGSLKRYQTGWKWDKKSQNLIYSENSGEISPAGGKPDFNGSYNYALAYK